MGSTWVSRGAFAAWHGTDDIAAADGADKDTTSAVAANDDRNPCLSTRHRRCGPQCDVSYRASSTHASTECSHEWYHFAR